MKNIRLRESIIAGLLYVFFGVLLIVPIVRVTSAGFLRRDGRFTFDYVLLVFEDHTLVLGLVNALVVAVAVTALCLLIAVPLAMLSVRYDFPGRKFLTGMLLAPLVLPPFVGAVGMRLVLGRLGPLTMLLGMGGGAGFDWLSRFRLGGIILVQSLHLYPILLLNVQAALANLDPAMEQAAANLGADRWTVFRRVTLPLMRPGLFAGATLTLIWSFTDLGTPLMFDFDTITPVQVFRQITEISGNPLPYALVVVTLAVSAGLYFVGKVIWGRGYEAATSRAATVSAPRQLTGMRGLLAAAPFVVVLALALLPHISVILTSMSVTGSWYRSFLPTGYTMGHFQAALSDDLALSSVRNSATYAALATLLAVIVGLAAARLIVRGTIPGRGFLDALAMLPLAVPGLVLAFGYLSISVAMKQRFGPRLPRWLDVQEFPVVLLVLAYAARRMPYVVRSVAAGLQQTPRDLELAGANLGARPSTVLYRITLPLISANLVAGALLAFAFTLLEVSDSLILAQKQAYFPMTRAILDLSERLGDGLYVASALGVWAMVLLAITILVANKLLGRGMGALFRA